VGRHFTPNDVFLLLREQCARRAFQSNYEGGAKALSECHSNLVFDIYYALTGRELMYQTEQPASSSQVISDFTYEVDDRVHILGGAKSPRVFDHFIGELMGQMRDGSPVQLCVESTPTNYSGYKAMLAKVRVVVSVSRILSESYHLYL
jgi:hypothetical protein